MASNPIAAIDHLNSLDLPEVERVIRASGVRGVKARCGQCILARYFQKVGLPFAEVGIAGIFNRSRIVGRQSTIVISFRQAFDRGEYPDLEETTTKAKPPPAATLFG